MRLDVDLKPLEQQTIVITGASSGVGLVTAKMAARRGASVVLVARGEEGLRRAVDEIRADGGEAMCIVADVSSAEDMERVAETVIREYEGFDSWINNASVAIYGRLDEISLEDKRRLFDVNFWGVVHGCRAALPHLRARGGALINVGSALSDGTVPLLGIYSASKHAVKGYVDALRMELEKEGAPVAVTLVTPGSMDTPFFEHAKNYMKEAPKPFPPVYAPEIAAETLLECCERPVRDITIGAGGKALSVMGRYTPRLADKVLELTAFREQKYDDKPIVGTHNLYEPMPGSEHGRYDGHVMRSSMYTAAALHPLASTLAVVGLAGAVIGAMALFGRRRDARGVEVDIPTRPATGRAADTAPPTARPFHPQTSVNVSTPRPPAPDAERSRGIALVADSAEGMAHVPTGVHNVARGGDAGVFADRTEGEAM